MQTQKPIIFKLLPLFFAEVSLNHNVNMLLFKNAKWLIAYDWKDFSWL